MLADMLQKLIDDETTSAREIGELAGVSTSTVYRWINRESQPDFDSIRILLKTFPQRKAQEALVSVFTAGTNWSPMFQEHDLDVNHDGKVDAEDALDACIETVRHAAETLHAIRKNLQNRKTLTAEQTIDVLSLLQDVQQNATVTQRILIDLGDADRRRLKIAK